ncbi:carbamoyl phosphate synthase small subunit [Alteribacter populi]|uniref:carbamoyl phosphate synthase small subunit n=1 Tax=Alteribacter populi TaxID=2011011 RepID=UPI000BBAEBB1|nr:carbamoyl phosphate synthase small subunit [Alteribacter populi]
MSKGYLILETGEIFEGKLIGELNHKAGEVVFNTGMTGYQEMITDPSYAGQILTFCYPIIGNYGVNDYDNESFQTAVSGVIVGDLCDEPSHYQATKRFSDQLEQAGVPGLAEVDTRALVQTIRKHHTVNGTIARESDLLNVHDKWQEVSSAKLVDHVSTKEVKTYKGGYPHIVIMDYGYKKSILAALLNEGCSVTIVPYTYSFDQVKSLEPDGVLLSNGPGDPMALASTFSEIKKITQEFPTLGICLGHQLIALTYGGKTKKQSNGHRGGNHPVKELLTGKVRITSQNHGYVVVEDRELLTNFQISFRNVNDGTVEGIKHLTLPVQSVQFHPEAHPGPSDTEYLFAQFLQQAIVSGGKRYAEA